VTWKILNYEQPSNASLAAKFEIQMPVVVLAKMKAGQIEQWKRLDQVWGLVGNKPAFAKFIREQVAQMLGSDAKSPVAESKAAEKANSGPPVEVPKNIAPKSPAAKEPLALPLPE